MTHDEMDEVIRHFDVVMEAVRSDVRAVGDGHVMLSEKIDHLDHEVAGLKEQTAKLDVGLAAVATRTERVETAVVALTDRTEQAGDGRRRPDGPNGASWRRPSSP